MSKPVFRTISARASVTSRHAKYDGRDHVVAPTVALVGDIVMQARGSIGPELVPAALLARAPVQWNGRPVVLRHPAGVTANNPNVLESQGLGVVFGAEFKNNALQMEAWLDVDRALKIGDEALAVVNAVSNNETINVSIGAMVRIDPTPGVTADGRSYSGVWTEIVADHLAILPDEVGACSVAHGCGTVRAAALDLDADDLEETVRMSKLVDFWNRVVNHIPRYLTEGVADVELRDLLWNALRAVEPGFDWVIAVYPDSNEVVYAVRPEDHNILYRRSYTLADGKVTLGDDRVEVSETRSFEPVAASLDPAATGDPATLESEQLTAVAACSGGCSCKTKGAERSAHDPHKEEGNMPTKAERVQALIDNTATPFAATDNELLAAYTDDQIAVLEQAFEKVGANVKVEPVPTPEATAAVLPVTPPAPAAQPAAAAAAHQPAATPRALTVEEYLPTLPAAIRPLVERSLAEEKGRRTSAIEAIVAASNGKFTAEQLSAKPTDELQTLHELLVPVPSFVGGAGVTLPWEAPRAASVDPKDHTPPSSWKVDVQ